MNNSFKDNVKNVKIIYFSFNFYYLIFVNKIYIKYIN